ncbi:MAG TPA: MFS transporter [Gemmatimonadaceae bacterium]|nr:MFS transporter [Gemmatimonadaceae bacterium]
MTSTRPVVATDHVGAARATRREWIGLAVLTLPCFLLSMDLTVLFLALPALSADLQPSSAQLLWIVDIYGFLIAGSLITMGTLGDRIGRRRLLLIGAAAFGVASTVAAFSTSAEMLIATRALLGVAGATLMPSTLALIRNMFHDPAQRSTAISIWVTSFMVGGAIGPLLGGVMLEHFWWGSVFLLNVPVMALLLVIGPVLLPENRDPNAGHLDLLSAGLSLVAILAVIYGIKRVAQDGFSAASGMGIVAGFLIGAVFVLRQRRLTHPLIDLDLFRVPAFSTSVGTQLISLTAMNGIYLFAAQYLQLVFELSPLHAGLWLLPSTVFGIAGSMLAPVAARRIRPAYVMGAGLMLGAIGFGVLSQMRADSGIPHLVTAFIILSIGIGATLTVTTDLIVGVAPPERAGAASAISETSSELGLALGIALIGSLGTAVYRRDITRALPEGMPAEVAEAARDTLGSALALAARLPDQIGTELARLARAAFLHAMETTAITGTAILVGLAIVVILVLRHLKPRASSS